jgi:hypothetical protein
VTNTTLPTTSLIELPRDPPVRLLRLLGEGHALEDEAEAIELM